MGVGGGGRGEGGEGVRRFWVDLQCRGVLLIWIIVGQGPIVLTVGAGECVYSHLSLLFSFFISLGDVPI